MAPFILVTYVFIVLGFAPERRRASWPADDQIIRDKHFIHVVVEFLELFGVSYLLVTTILLKMLGCGVLRCLVRSFGNSILPNRHKNKLGKINNIVALGGNSRYTFDE